MKKRILSLLLTLAMVLTLAPVAFATGDDAAQDANSVEAVDTAQVEPQEDAAGEDASVTTAEDATAVAAKIGETNYATLKEAIGAATAGQTVTLQADVTGQTVIPAEKNITLDLNGHKMTNTGDTLVNEGALTITDSEKTGAIVSGRVGLGVGNNSKTTIKYAKIQSVEGAIITGLSTGATITVEDGEFSASDNFVVAGNGSKRDGDANKITINGGTFNGKIKSAGYIACGIYAPWKDIITVNDGTFNVENGIGIVARAGQVTVNGGTFTCTGTAKGKVGDKNFDMDAAQALYFDASDPAYPAYNSDTDYIRVSGGVFSSDVKDYCTGEFKTVQNSDGTYTVKSKNVAQVGETEYETLQAAITAAARDGAMVTLLDDTTEDVTIAAGKNITLDLGGKALTNTNAGKATVQVENGATATVQNGSVIGGTGHYNIAAGTSVNSTANLKLVNVTATAGNTGSSMIDNWGTLTIESGTYTGGLNVVKSEEGSTLNISGGEFTLNYAVAYQYNGVILTYGTTTISGGTFNQNATTPLKAYPSAVMTGVVEGYTAKTVITGGTFNNKHSNTNAKIFWAYGKATSANFEVTGGKFNQTLSTSYVPNGYATAKEADGYYHLATAITKVTLNETEIHLKGGETYQLEVTSVEPADAQIKTVTWGTKTGNAAKVSSKGLVTAQRAGTRVITATPAGKGATVATCTVYVEDGDAAIGSTQYPTLDKALAAAKNGDTIKLLNDIEQNERLVLNKNITLDLNGKKIYNTKDIWDVSNALIGVEDGASVTLTGEGTVSAKENDCYAIEVKDGSLTIENGTIIGNVSAVQVTKGHLDIKGGKFDLLQKWDGNKFLINCIDDAYKDGSATVAISGGTFVDFDPANNKAEGNGTNFCASGYKSELTNGVYVVKAGTNDALSAIDTALEAVKNDADISEAATKKAVQDALTEVAAIPNETLSGNSTTMDKLAQLDAAAKKGGIEVKVTSTATGHDTVTAENAALSADPAKTDAQTVTITVADKKDTAAVTKAQEAAGATAKLGANALGITMNVNGTPVTTPSAPVVLTFTLPENWKNAEIVRVDDENSTTEIVPSTISNGKISGVFNHFSTYVLVQTEAVANLNQYEFVLTPNKTDVSAGDELTYTVTLKHTAGKDTDKVGYFIFAPTIANKDLLELDTTKTTANNDKKVFFGKASGTYEFTLTDGGVELKVGESMDVGTLVYKVKAYDTDKTTVLVTGSNKDQVTNVRYQNSLTPTMSITNGVTYHVTKVTFKQDDKTADQVYYARYGTSDLYENADLTGDKVSVAEPTDTSTEYRLADKKWHLSTDLSQTYETTTEFKESVTYVTKKIPLVKITIPADVVEVPGTTEHPVTDRTDGKYVDKTEELTFTVKPAPTPGERYDVIVKVDGEEVTTVKNDDGSYTVAGKDVTGEVTFEYKSVLDLDEDDIYIFTDGEGETLAYRKYSAYSGTDTLVLIKGKTNVNYTLNAGQPTIYKTAAYKDLGGYTHAVLVPGEGAVSKQAMLAYLKEQGLKVTNTANESITINWDTNGNGLGNPKNRDLGDVQATNDFKTYPESEEWNWTPTDKLLLLADVLTIKDDTSDVYVEGSYTQLRDGRVSDNDVNAFVYYYAKLGK